MVNGADVDRISDAVGVFPEPRRADLWSGVGLACAYAGGADAAAIQTLHRSAGPYTPQLAQGAAFAAKARVWAGNQTEHTDLACQTLCGISAEAAAQVTDANLERLPSDATLQADAMMPAYEVWRQRQRR